MKDNEKIYNLYCDKTNLPEKFRKKCKKNIIETIDYKYFLLEISIDNLRKSIIKSLQDFLKK